ncbi:KLHL8 protein, partial [Crocuta crocuta]
ALASLGGPIYAIGGLDDNTCFNDVERYDIESDQWSTVAPMNTPRGGVGSVALIVSGFDDNSPLSSVERYDPRSNKWDYVAALTTPRGGVGIATVMGKIFAVGGHNGNAYLNTVEAFD